MDGAVAAVVTVRLICLEWRPTALVALTVNVKTPAAVGVPLMVPVDDPMLSPAGNPPPVTASMPRVVPAAIMLEEPRVTPPGSTPLVTAHVIGVVPEAIRVCE